MVLGVPQNVSPSCIYFIHTLAYNMQQQPTQSHCFKFIKHDVEIV